MCKNINNVLEMKITLGTSLVVQCLRLHASTAGGVGSIPDWEAKILRAKVQPKKEKKKKSVKRHAQTPGGSEGRGGLGRCSPWGQSQTRLSS